MAHLQRDQSNISPSFTPPTHKGEAAERSTGVAPPVSTCTEQAELTEDVDKAVRQSLWKKITSSHGMLLCAFVERGMSC